MQFWRKTLHRPMASRARAFGRLVISLGLALILLVGCARGGRHESWPGMKLVDGVIYAANLENVQALNAETGALYWSFPGGEEENDGLGPFYAPPTYVEGYGANGMLIVAGFKDQTVYALSLGESPETAPGELWRYSGAGGQYVGGGTVADGKYIIGNGDGSVYALSLENGQKAWDFATGDRVWATPLVSGDEVYIASLDHHLYAVDLQTGDELWRIEFEGALSATPVLAGERLWVGDFTSNLYEVDPSTGEVVWQYEAMDWLWANPLLDGTTLYFSDISGHVYALDVETREMLWDSPAFIDDVAHGSPTLDADSTTLFVAGFEKGQIHALDVSTGSEVSWGSALENPGRLPGDLISDDARVYAMPILIEARVRAFDIDTGGLVWQYPVAK
jgi:eukaryotic-like serine/threonine-protein kinase